MKDLARAEFWPDFLSKSPVGTVLAGFLKTRSVTPLVFDLGLIKPLGLGESVSGTQQFDSSH